MLQLTASGILGRDPEISTYGEGKTRVRFSVAAKVRTSKGPETVWVSVTVFGKQAEVCAKYLHKKSRVLVIGTPSTKVYTSKTEEVMASLDLLADNVEFLDGGQGSQEDGGMGSQSAEPSPFAPVHDSDMPF